MVSCSRRSFAQGSLTIRSPILNPFPPSLARPFWLSDRCPTSCFCFWANPPSPKLFNEGSPLDTIHQTRLFCLNVRSFSRPASLRGTRLCPLSLLRAVIIMASFLDAPPTESLRLTFLPFPPDVRSRSAFREGGKPRFFLEVLSPNTPAHASLP